MSPKKPDERFDSKTIDTLKQKIRGRKKRRSVHEELMDPRPAFPEEANSNTEPSTIDDTASSTASGPANSTDNSTEKVHASSTENSPVESTDSSPSDGPVPSTEHSADHSTLSGTSTGMSTSTSNVPANNTSYVPKHSTENSTEHGTSSSTADITADNPDYSTDSVSADSTVSGTASSTSTAPSEASSLKEIVAPATREVSAIAQQETQIRKRKTKLEVQRELLKLKKQRGGRKKFIDRMAKVTLYLDPDLRDLLYLEAEAQGKPVYQVLDRILRDHYSME